VSGIGVRARLRYAAMSSPYERLLIDNTSVGKSDQRIVRRKEGAMKSSLSTSFILGAIAIALTGCAKAPEIGTIRSVCLVVEQRHPKVGGNWRLPIEQRLTRILNRMGVDVREAGQACDARFTVSLTFDIFGPLRFPTATPRVLYSGSKATGEARLEVEGFQTLREPLSGRQATSVVNDSYVNTGEILYRETVEYVVMDAMINIWGEPALISLLAEGQALESSFWEMFENNSLSVKDVVPMLLAAFHNKDATVRENALRVIKHSTGVITIGPNRIRAFLRKRDGVVDSLLGLIQAGNPQEIRFSATYILGHLALEPDRVVPVLISLLRAADSEDLSIAAMDGLAEYGSESISAVPLLEAMLTDGSERIRRVAGWTLEKIRR
jgi:hypothetical protein